MSTAKKAKGKLTTKVAKPQKVPSNNADAQSDDDAVMQEDGSDASSMDDGDTTDAESDYEAMSKKRKKDLKKNKAKTAEPGEFADILSSILAQDVVHNDLKAPIMAKDKTRERMIKEEKLNYRARKALAEEKRLLLSKDRVIPTFESMNYERGLRKVATRGVIKLFNVVKAQQAELNKINATQTTQTEKVAEMSKSKFLDLLKTKTS
ncbi:pre-60S ribosomal particles component [Coemansia sp. RSA 2399]|nr:pre-60S ribosomal particles component [Coemansia sp. RSA 2399]KAJ1906491.1 pre-60S ribosomal particles component [Coemansia sp. IMI 209127]